MGDRNRTGEFVLGAQRSGKSHYSNERCKDYQKSGGSCLVYNLGKESDFDSCELGALVGIREHEEILRKEKGENFVKNWKKEPYYIYIKTQSFGVIDIKDFNKFFKGRGLKVKRLTGEIEDIFFETLFKRISNTLIIFDDCKHIFKANLREWQNELLARMNHCGSHHKIKSYRGRGNDIILIYHSFNHIYSQVLDYYNDDYIFTCFVYKTEPDYTRLSDEELEESLKETFFKLKELPQYSRTHFYKGKTIVKKPTKK